MNTLHKIKSSVKSLREKYINKAKQFRFSAGVSQLSLQEFSSLNAAGRKLGGNRWTAESRIRRVVNDDRLSDQVQRLILSEVFAGRSGQFFLSLDHSQFGPFCIAVLAISFRKGRAIPIWCQVNKSQGALIAPLVTALEDLFDFIGRVSPTLRLVLVMDRWFASEKLIRLIIEHGQFFIVRTKSDKLVQMPYDPSWWTEPIGDISSEELPITYKGIPLRFIRSDYDESMKGEEPWFLLTNLVDRAEDSVYGLTRRQILNRYAERFEIEEDFKDIKWLQRLEWQKVKKTNVIRSLLLFIFLGWWILWQSSGKHTVKRGHTKKQLSWFRQAWENFQSQIFTQFCLLT